MGTSKERSTSTGIHMYGEMSFSNCALKIDWEARALEEPLMGGSALTQVTVTIT